jgi:hypothetical protein
LYFLARKRLFPVIGILAAATGAIVAATNFLA